MRNASTSAGPLQPEPRRSFDYDYEPDIVHEGTHVKLRAHTVAGVTKALTGIHAIVLVLTGASLAEQDEDATEHLSPTAIEGLRTAIDALATLSSDVLAAELMVKENFFDGYKGAH